MNPIIQKLINDNRNSKNKDVYKLARMLEVSLEGLEGLGVFYSRDDYRAEMLHYEINDELANIVTEP